MAILGSYRNAFEDTGDFAEVDATPSGLSNLAVDPVTTSATTAGGLASAITPEQAEMERKRAEANAQAEREYAAQQKAAADNVTDLGNGTFRLADGRIFDSSGNLVTDTATVSGLDSVDQTPTNQKTIQLTGKDYKIDTTVADKLAQQIIAQGTTSKWQGEGFGSAEANARAMAEQLAANGVTDINQVGMINKTVDEAVTPKIEQIDTGQYDENGPIYTQRIVGYTDSKGNPVDPSKVTQTDEGYVAPVGTQQVIGNKATGQALINDYGERGTGNAWSGTYAGSGNTAYRVQFDAQGNPYFYTTGASSNDLKAIMDDLGPLGQIALAVATGGLSIPEQIAANMAVQVLSGKDIGDAIKSAAISYAGAQIPGLDAVKEGTSFIKDLGLPAGVTDSLTRGFQNAAVSGATALLSGQDVGNAMMKGAVSGGTSGAVNALMGNIDGFKDLTPAQKNMAINAVTGVISGKPLDQIVINTAIAAANAEVAKVRNEKTDQVVSPYFTPTSGLGTTTGATPSGLDASVAKELDNQLTIDASGARDVNAAAKFATDQGYNKFIFDGQTYTAGNNNAENTIAQLEAEALKTNTAANLAGGDMAGVDAQAAANAKDNAAKVVKIGNTEADTEQEAQALAKARNPNATQFEYNGSIYTMGASNSAVDQALAEAKAEELKNNIANAPSKSEAYKLAREGLGAGQNFTWQGQTFSTSTAEEQAAALNAKNLASGTPEQKALIAARNANAISEGEAVLKAISDTNMANMTPEMRAVVKAQNDMAARDAATRANVALQNKAINPDDDLVVDAMGNTVSGSKNYGSNELLKTTAGKITNGVADAMTTFFGAVANSPVAAVQAGGNLLGNAGGIIDLVAGKSTDAGNKLRELAGQVDTFATSISDPKIKLQQQQIGEDVDNAEGLAGKTAALMSSAFNNPLGAANWVLTEAFEEVPGVGMAMKTGSKIARYGISLANDMMESGGAAYNDTYKSAIAQKMPEAEARIAARNSSIAAMIATGVTGGAVEGKVLSKMIAKNSVGELVEGSAQAAASQLALGQGLDANKILTQGVIEMGVGKGASSTANAVTATNINNDITAAVTSGDAGGVNTAITNSVQNSLSNGASVSVAVGTSVGSAITNGADANSSIITAVSSALDSGADVGETITSSISSAITAGADSTLAIDSTVTSAITGGADSSVVVDSAVTSAITAGADVTSSIATAVKAAVDNGVNVTTATNAATTAAVTASITAGADTSTAITSSVAAAVAAGADASTAATVATSAAVTASVTAGTDVSTAITTAVSSAVTAGADVTTASNAAVTSAVTASVAAGTDTATAISTSVTAAVDAGADVGTAATTATTAAVTASIAAGTDVTTAVSTAVTAAVDAGASVTTATNAATTAAVTSAITSGTDVSTAISNSVTAAVAVGADATTAANTATTAAVTASINAGTNVSTAITTAVNAAVNVGADANTVVGNAITAAINAGADVNTSITTAITTAIEAGTNANTSVATAVNAAINAGVDSTVAINAAVQAAIEAGVDVNTAINTAVNTAVNANTNVTTDANVDANTNVTTNVNADTNVVTNANTDANADVVANADLPVTSVSSVVGGLPTSDVLTVDPLDALKSTVSETSSTPSVSPLSTTVSVSKPPVLPRKPTTASKYSPSDFADPTLDSSPQFLKGAGKEKAMQLASLKQLFSSLTPEMQEVLEERGFKPPEESSGKEDKKKDKKSDEDKTYEEFMAEEDAKLTPEQMAEKYGTKFAASGGSILDQMNPKYIESAKGLTAAPVVGTGGVESPLKLMGIKHLREGIAKAPRALGGYAKGGLPAKYAKAAPKGHNPEFITGLTGYYATGNGTGQSDDIPAMLHDGDYVIDADAVAALGDGSSKAGAEALAGFQKKVPHSMSSGGSAVPAKIADGEYVFPEAFVTAIGGGDNKRGAKLLDAMREELRAHKRSAPTSKIPPKAKSPLDYLRMAKG